METAVRRRGRRSCVYEIYVRRASKTPPHHTLELQGLVAPQRTCRPCLALPLSSGFWPKACGNFGLVGKLRQHNFTSSTVIIENSILRISCITSPSLYLTLYTRASSSLRHLHCRLPIVGYRV